MRNAEEVCSAASFPNASQVPVLKHVRKSPAAESSFTCAAPFDARWREASWVIVATMRAQQRKHGPGPYRFQRRTSWNPDSVPGNGYGNPMHPVGLIVSLFRPSDDAAIQLRLWPPIDLKLPPA